MKFSFSNNANGKVKFASILGQPSANEQHILIVVVKESMPC